MQSDYDDLSRKILTKAGLPSQASKYLAMVRAIWPPSNNPKIAGKITSMTEEERANCVKELFALARQRRDKEKDNE